jgi:sugar phosphate isomerase/epimerase
LYEVPVIGSSVTVSLVPETRGGPFVFWDDLAAACQKARSLGFDAVEIFPPAAAALDAQQVRKLLAEHHLVLAAMGTGAGWVKHRLHLSLPDAPGRVRARDFIRTIIDLAGALGAPAIIGSMQGRSGDGVDHGMALGYLAEALNDLGEHARGYGVPLLLEPLNRYETNLLNTLEAGVRLLGSLSTTNVKLLADLFHMNIEEVNLARALRGARGHLGHVHFVDSNRRPAGLGHLEYPPIVEALREIAYDGFASAEALPYPDPDVAAAQTMTAFRRYFGEQRC